MSWNYETIKALARQLRDEGESCQVTDLIALAPQNDPFYTGTEGERAKASWFAELWGRFGYRSGVHLRRVHYQLVSQDPLVEKPNGGLYENTERDWGYLTLASKCARYLGLVEPEAFVDRRNPDAIVNAGYWPDPTPGYRVEKAWFGEQDIALPAFPTLEAEGYRGNLQPYHLEIWVEKTTMNDVLEPLCRRYGVNLVTGAGEMSITAAIDLVERAREAERPCRIFYVSDFDPAGYGMPVSVARKLEFFVRDRDLDLDIALEPIALTRQQVVEFGLPRQPIKDSELRKGAFEDVHGEGAVELDALEALHPGALARIAETAILDYYDPGVEERAGEQRSALAEALESKRQEAISDLEADVEELEADFEQAVGDLKRRWRDLSDRIACRLNEVEVDLDDYPLPEGREVWESDGKLFDSERDYLDQLACYKARQNGS